jgi:type IV secretory pathway VirB3-like protein
MEQSKKAAVYKYMSLVSTVFGAIGVYFLHKQLIVLGWVLVCIWVVLVALVRILIMRDKKLIKVKSREEM